MLTSASKQSQYRKGEKSGKDRDKKRLKPIYYLEILPPSVSQCGLL